MKEERLDQLERQYKSAIRKPWGIILELVEEVRELRKLIKDICNHNGFNTHCTCYGKGDCLYCRHKKALE